MPQLVRGANVAVVASFDTGTAILANAAGMIVIVIGNMPQRALDLRRTATQEGVRLLERREVLAGHEELLTEGEGI